MNAVVLLVSIRVNWGLISATYRSRPYQDRRQQSSGVVCSSVSWRPEQDGEDDNGLPKVRVSSIYGRSPGPVKPASDTGRRLAHSRHPSAAGLDKLYVLLVGCDVLGKRQALDRRGTSCGSSNQSHTPQSSKGKT